MCVFHIDTYYKAVVGNTCPPDKIVTEVKDCICAAYERGLVYKGTEVNVWQPTGCYWSDTSAYLNRDVFYQNKCQIDKSLVASPKLQLS